VHGLPEDYYDRYREHVRSMSIERLLDAAHRHVHPESLQMVVVGEPSVVRGPLEALGFGPIALYDTLGNPTK
jgi:predicted Zn-dependent peptidase